jgi:hypothetical protein
MLSVANKHFMQSVVMLNVIMLNAVAPRLLTIAKVPLA